MLREFALSTKEGLALMVLAEALLRVPDARTADQFIEDKLGEGDFIHHETKSSAFLVNASAWALGMSARVIQPGETPQGTIGRLAKRLGAPAVRAATRQAMRLMGSHFVLGETIEAALARAQTPTASRYSFDMLGEGARTAEDAQRYFDSYATAIDAIGRSAGGRPLPERPGISVKLSALHPRFEAVSHARVMAELVPRLIELARRAKSYDLNFTVDAEEADRLELSLDVMSAAFADPSLKGWDGFGLAIQAYQKRAAEVIAYVDALARAHARRMMVRLVKGAYWDTEIKRAQERGLDGYPVFTRKAMTDLNYINCAERLLALRPRIFPQFATHNALTVATVLELAGGESGFEFQRLHGMGEALYACLSEDNPKLAYRTYAPVGSHRDLLAYLVRRLLENGANSSFVALAADDAIPVETLLRRPAEIIGSGAQARHPKIPLPRDLLPQRVNSRGIEFGERAALAKLVAEIARAKIPVKGSLADASRADAERAVATARAGFPAWSATPATERAAMLEKAADLLESRAAHVMALLQREGGKTLDDALSELREAADFCRYYAAEGRKLFGASEAMPGPTGESNALRLRGRGVFVAISPWNFPLAIFLGQVTAALMAGNAVVAKPAEQTPLVAAEAVKLLHEAGVPPTALQFVPGDGATRRGSGGASRYRGRGVHRLDRGRAYDQPRARRQGRAYCTVHCRNRRHQCDDRGRHRLARAGRRRCHDLGVPLRGPALLRAAAAVRAGGRRRPHDRDDQRALPAIEDRRSRRSLDPHRPSDRRRGQGAPGRAYRAHARKRPGFISQATRRQAISCAAYFRIARRRRTQRGSVRADPARRALRRRQAGKRAARHRAHRLRTDPRHSLAHRRHGRCRHRRLQVGNIYVNRNMVGAVVGVQPFGGQGLSGTGPKAGGPHYLARFATEQTVTINTAAAGGNAALLSGDE